MNKTVGIKKRKAKGPSCDCIRQVNEKLKDKGVQIRRDFLFQTKPTKVVQSPPIVELVRNDAKSRVKVPTLMCSHCPFCGKLCEM